MKSDPLICSPISILFRHCCQASLFLIVLQVGVGLPDATAQDADSKSDLAEHYGFKPLEIFKLSERANHMLTGDFNKDGLSDVLLIDNSHSRLDLLRQRTSKPEAAPDKLRVNEIQSDWRFEHIKIPVNKEVTSSALGDFNGDGKTDIAYFGLPDRLMIRYQPANGDWLDQQSLRVPDVQTRAWNMAGGDLNQDGRDDLVMIGKQDTYVLYGPITGASSNLVRLKNTSTDLSMIQIADLDGNERNDICYFTRDDTEHSFCVRFQSQRGQLGPELRYALRSPRGFCLHNTDGKPGEEIIAIDSQTGRVKIWQLKRPRQADGQLASHLIRYGFGSSSARETRDMTTGDFDGNNLTDVVVSDPSSAQMLVYRQTEQDGLDLGEVYPGLLGATQIRAANLDDKTGDELVVLSTSEKTLGLSQFQDGRLTFPKALMTTGEPVAIELADLNNDEKVEIVYISREKKSGKTEYGLRALKFQNENWKPTVFGDSKQDVVKLEISGLPERLSKADLNQDGTYDFIIYPELRQTPILLLTSESGLPQRIETVGGIQLGNVSPGAIFVSAEAKSKILVAQKNFARALRLDDHRRWQVIDQINAQDSSSNIVGVAALNLDNKSGREVVLVDSGVHKLRIIRQEENMFKPWREIELGEFPYISTHVADLNGDQQDDLILFGRGKFAVLYSGHTDPELVELASFETRLKEVFFADVVAGDLNADQKPDIAVIDMQSHYIEILNYDPQAGLRHALHWKLFESKSFSGDDNVGSEPRETMIVDVTGDKRADLLFLTHDRLLLYPQDPGQAAAASAQTR